jgi:serine/threonine protein kinase
MYAEELEEALRRMLSKGQILLDRYEIMDTLGGGASGTIYLVRDLRFSDVYRALKEVEEGGDFNASQEIRDLFAREKDLLQSLNHPGLPKLTDSFSRDNWHYLVMEFVEGETLDDLLKRNRHPFAPEEVIPWALQIARILEYLHSQAPHPVIFRDLKPSNIMVAPGGRIKLIDFGIARYFRPYKSKDTYFMGTPGFAAPEQYGNAQSDARSDIFSFGATLYHLLTHADMEAFNFAFPRIGKTREDIPEWLDELVLTCLAKDPGNRVQSAAEIVKTLESRAEAAPGPARAASALRSPGAPITLIHCCVVFAIIAVLAAILVPNFLRSHTGGSLTACKSNLKNIGTAMEMYSSDNDGRFPLSLRQLTPRYLHTLPTCASAGEMSYSYMRREKPDNYTAYCSGSYHKGVFPPGFPQYDGVQGLYDH